MKRCAVGYSDNSKKDAAWIYRTIAAASGRDVALGYVKRIREFCDRLEYAAERSHRRDDLRAGLRVVGFERRVSIAFSVDDERVNILPIFYGGRNWEEDFR